MKRVTMMARQPAVVHARSWDESTRTFCGKVVMRGRTELARRLSEITCRSCRRLYITAEEAESIRKVEARNLLEERAKACFEIFARAVQPAAVWETENEDTRQAFRQIVEYLKDVLEEEFDERREHEEG